MDPMSGKIVRVEPGSELPEGYGLIPPYLEPEVTKLLGDRREGCVAFDGDGPLAQYARDQRAAAERKVARRRRNNKTARRARRTGKVG